MGKVPEPLLIETIDFPGENIRNSEFYTNNYDILLNEYVDPQKKKFLGTKDNRTCRFCGLDASHTTFHKEAHALSHCIGNNSLFSFYECDMCNEFFGKHLEDSYAKFFKMQHLVYRVTGKKGIPKVKDKKSGGVTTQYSEIIDGQLHIQTQDIDDDITIEVMDDHAIWKCNVDSFVPIAVYKTLVKMALTVMPEVELSNYQKTIEWIHEREHHCFYDDSNKPHLVKHVVIPTYVGLPMIVYRLFKLKTNGNARDQLPTMLFQLIYGHMSLLIEVPTATTETPVDMKDFPFPPFLMRADEKEVVFINFTDNPESIDFSLLTSCKNHVQKIRVDFSAKSENAFDPKETTKKVGPSNDL